MQETSVKQVASRAELHAGFLLDLFIDPEDRGDIFFRNVVDFQRTILRYIPGDGSLHGKIYFYNCSFIIMLMIYEAKLQFGTNDTSNFSRFAVFEHFCR
jgi:hypothetical protein